MNSLRTILLVTLIAVSTSGCGTFRYGPGPDAKPRPEIHNPLPALQALSLVPVLAPERYAERDWTSRLQQTLLSVQGIDQVHVVPWPQESVKSGRLPKLHESSQGLLQIKILNFNPYYPPSAHVEVDFYVPRGIREIDPSILELERHGSPPMARRAALRTPWVRFQKTYRVNDPDTAERLERYAASEADQSGMAAIDRVTRISDRFMDFVMYETLNECFARIGSKEKETNGFLGEFLAGPAQ